MIHHRNIYCVLKSRPKQGNIPGVALYDCSANRSSPTLILRANDFLNPIISTEYPRIQFWD
jgi:hypothetical protein